MARRNGHAITRAPPPQAGRLAFPFSGCPAARGATPPARQALGMRSLVAPGPPFVRRLCGALLCGALLCGTLLCGAAVSAPPGASGGVHGGIVSASRSPWVWPVPAPIRVLAPFRAPMTPYSAGHRGIDLAVEPGAEVVAAGPGTVRHAGWVVDRFLVSIDHGDGILSSIEPVEPSVTTGDAVARGAPIGKVASGGHCAAGCAHFGVRVHGVYVSPLLFLGGVPRAVLLPLEH